MKLTILFNGTKRKVKVTPLIVRKEQDINSPIITRIEYKTDAGETVSTYIDGNSLITQLYTVLAIK
jgi:hypothetical protein